MKETLRQKIKRKWNEFTDGTKGIIVGTIFGTAVTAVIAGAVDSHQKKVMANLMDDICDAENKLAYDRGVQDGQIKAYHTLLTQPEKAFKQMGMSEIRKF